MIDATGCWVTPGFIDIHTHYDGEVEALPALPESLRHGVTTVFLGSCSLAVAMGTAEDLADQFTRVEGIPRDRLLEILSAKKTWDGYPAYVDHFDRVPLGPNVTSFVGYSAVRSCVMGLERSLTAGENPTREEMGRITSLVEEGLDAGCLGVSTNTLYWDKMGGERFNSRCLPCTYATWGEMAEIVQIARRRGRVYQTIPNISTKYELLFVAFLSAGFFVRKALKTSLVSMMDIRSNRQIYRVLQALGFVFNRLMGGNFRYQALPTPFDLYADGMDLVVFEEFGAGAASLHLQYDPAARKTLINEPSYRSWFKRQWMNPFLPKVFHRNFGMASVLDCPDSTVVGMSFAEIAKTRGQHAVDTFLDLVSEHGTKLRWYTMMGNDRKDVLGSILNTPSAMVGFSDAGAHLRNMAYYNFALRMLKLVQDTRLAGHPIMPLEKAVWKLTGELADWFGIDAGHLEVGRRADLVVIDPSKLDDSLEAIHEEPVVALGGYRRLVRRNDDTVRAVVINGKIACERGAFRPEVGREQGYGQFLRAASA
jgi:N-acyl-D-aspartate/D-glutamate deacylase